MAKNSDLVDATQSQVQIDSLNQALVLQSQQTHFAARQTDLLLLQLIHVAFAHFDLNPLQFDDRLLVGQLRIEQTVAVSQHLVRVQAALQSHSGRSAWFWRIAPLLPVVAPFLPRLVPQVRRR